MWAIRVSGVIQFMDHMSVTVSSSIMDDDIVTLIGFTLIVNPSLRDHLLNNSVDQLNLSLYRRLSVR